MQKGQTNFGKRKGSSYQSFLKITSETVFSFQGPRVEDVLKWDFWDYSNFTVDLPIRTS